MRLTRFTDNALRCLTYLGLHESETATVTDVARRMSMSEDHLMKVVQRLASLGYVETIRGRNGGVRLVQDPAAIRIGTVVRQTEDNLNLVECFDAELNTCPIAASCQLARALDEALSAFLSVLDKYTLRDLLQQPRRLERLLRA
jgi:Rrf2 family nitric oxide-sensitive transcriptional repressor